MQKISLQIARAVFVMSALLTISFNILAQEKPNDAAKLNDAAITAALMKNALSDDTKRYRVGVGDTIQIEVGGHNEYSAPSVSIPDNGLIMLRRVEQPIQAVCKTSNELAVEITESYKTILRQPFVRVTVLSYQSQPVAVIGAVEKPGQFNLSRKMRLLEAVAVTGGPNKEAGSRISLARLGKASVCENPAAVAEGEQDLSKLLFSYSLKKTLEGDETANPWMEPGDIVYISESDKAFVVGNVKEPKTILLKTQRTVTQAIAEAGGILEATKKKQIILVRSDDAGNKTKIPLDLVAISQGKYEDPILRPNDIVEVPLDGKKAAINSIKKTLMQGLPSVLPFLF